MKKKRKMRTGDKRNRTKNKTYIKYIKKHTCRIDELEKKDSYFELIYHNVTLVMHKYCLIMMTANNYHIVKKNEEMTKKENIFDSLERKK